MGRWISGPTSILGGPGGTAAPGVGALVLTGLAPTVLAVPQAQTVMPGVGQLILTGKAPTVVVTLTGSFRTAMASQGLDASLWGHDPTPDTVFTSTDGAAFTSSGGYLDDATAAGACLTIKVTGGNDTVMAGDGSFSVSLWNGRFDDFADEVEGVSGGLTKMRTAVRNGVFRGILTHDDFTTDSGPNAFLHAVTYSELEACGAHAKARWPWMPLIARGVLTYMKQTAQAAGPGPRINGVRQYQYIDAGWLQYRPRLDAAIGTYLASELAAGESCALGAMGGINGLDQGAGTTPGWGCQPGSSNTDRCGCSPTEIRTCGFGMLNDPRIAGFHFYSYNFGPTYWAKPAIQAALQDLQDAAAGRVDGPVNIRGDLVAA